jgi:hypothetical protein
MLRRNLVRYRHRLILFRPGLPEQALPGVFVLPVGSGNLGHLQGVGQFASPFVELDQEPEPRNPPEPPLPIPHVAGRSGTRLDEANVEPAQPLNLAKKIRLLAAAPPQLSRSVLDEKVIVGRLARQLQTLADILEQCGCRNVSRIAGRKSPAVHRRRRAAEATPTSWPLQGLRSKDARKYLIYFRDIVGTRERTSVDLFGWYVRDAGDVTEPAKPLGH